MNKKKPTLKDIASIAGVSVSTVSMVLRGDKSISTDVSQRIYDIASNLGYKKKISNNSKPEYITIIEYESFDYQWNFIKPFLLNISKELRKQNIYSIIHHLDTETQDISGLEKAIINSGSIAVCSIHYFNDSFFNKLKRQGLPVVILNNNIFQEDFSSVCVDDFQGTYNGASYLIQKGHRNFLYIDYHREVLNACVVDRYYGFKKAMDEHAIPFLDKHRITIDLKHFNNDTNIVIDSVKKNPKTTAIFFHDDYIASKFIDEMENNHLRIPDDISIIAPGDTLDFSQTFTPQFTTLRIDTAMMGRMAAKLLLDQIHNPAGTNIQHLKVTPQIMDRGTCQKIP